MIVTRVVAAANYRRSLRALPCAGTLLSSRSGDPRRDVCAMSGVEGGLGPSCPGSHVHQAVAETCSKAWGFLSRSSARPGCLLLSQEAEHPRGLQQVKLKFLAQCGGPHEGAPPPPRLGLWAVSRDGAW